MARHINTYVWCAIYCILRADSQMGADRCVCFLNACYIHSGNILSSFETIFSFESRWATCRTPEKNTTIEHIPWFSEFKKKLVYIKTKNSKLWQFCQRITNLQTRIPMVGISNLNVELRNKVQHVLGHGVALHLCFCVGFSFVFLCSLRSMSKCMSHSNSCALSCVNVSIILE